MHDEGPAAEDINDYIILHYIIYVLLVFEFVNDISWHGLEINE